MPGLLEETMPLEPEENDPGQLATFNLNLSGRLGEQPELVTALHDKARELELPYPLVRRMDNRDLWKPYAAGNLRPSFRRLLAGSPDKVAMYRDQLPELDAFAAEAERSALPPERRAAERRAELERDGENPARIRELAARGYEPRGSDGDFARDGEVVRHPVFPDEVMGEEEKAAVARLLESAKKQLGADLPGLEGFEALSEAGKRRLAAGMISFMEHENAVMRLLNYNLPEGWNHLSDELLKKTLARGERVTGLDLKVDELNFDRMRKGGVGSVDLLDAVNLFGWRDVYAYATRLSPEELAAIDGDSPLDRQMAKLRYLADQSLDLRGRTLAGQTANVVVNALPFVAEFALTGGLASVAKAGARVGLVQAMKGTLRAGGFTGLGAGLKALGTKEGVKALGGAARMLASGEARRLPAYFPKIAAEALNEWDAGPVYVLGADGVEEQVPERAVADLGTLLLNKTLSTYLEHVSEGVGTFLPGVEVAKFIPERFRNALASRFLKDISADPAKRNILLSALADHVPLQGVLGEAVEEYVNNAFERGSTIAYEATGLSALNMNREAVFGNGDEDAVIFLSSALMGLAGNAVRLPGAAKNVMDTLRFVDGHQGMVEALAKTRLVERSAGQARDFVEAVRGGDVQLALDPLDAEVFFQSNPDFARTLGITEDTLAEAKANERLIPVSQNALLVEQARSPESNAAGEALLQAVRRTDLSVAEAASADLGEEAIQAYREQRERVEHFRRKAYTAMELAARQASGVPAAAVRNFSRIFGFMVNYLDAHTTDAAAVEEKLDKLCFAFSADPASFAGEPALNQAKVNDKGMARLARIARGKGFTEESSAMKLLSQQGSVKAGGRELFFDGGGAKHAVGEHLVEAGTVTSGGVTLQEVSDYLALSLGGERKVLPRSNKVDFSYTPEGGGVKYTARTYIGKDGRLQLASFFSSRGAAQTKKLIEDSRQSQEAKTPSQADHLQSDTNIAPDGEKSSLNQDADSPRGSFYPKDPAKFAESYDAVITLFKEADASTLPHECAHWMKRMVESMVEGGYADARMREDLARINRYLDRQKYENEAGTDKESCHSCH